MLLTNVRTEGQKHGKAEINMPPNFVQICWHRWNVNMLLYLNQYLLLNVFMAIVLV